MCDTTKNKIAEYGALTKLKEWYGVKHLEQIPESYALEFLSMLENKEIII